MPLTGEALIRVGGDVAGAQTALNSLNKSLKDSATATDTLQKKTAEGKGKLDQYKSTVGDVIQKMTGFSIASLTVAGGFAMVGKTIIEATRQVVDYNKQISDASRATRMGAEDLSRFVQVGDDMGIEMSSITRALELATKNGFAPSISSLAELADKANAMSTPTERAAMLAKILGRNWAEIDPILQMGGKRIKELAAAQKAGLVVTEREIAETEKFRLAMDELNDTKQAFLNTSGLAIVTAINLENEAFALAKKGVEEGTVAWWEVTAAQKHYADALKEGRAREEIFAIRDALGQLPPVAETAGEAIKDAFTMATEASVAAYLQDLEYKAGVDDITAAIAALRDKHVTITVTTITEEINRQTWEWRQQLATPGGHGRTENARGGPLGEITEVGEEGTEGIINGYVIPHPQWEAMKRSGIMPGRHMRMGGEDVEVGATTTPFSPTSFYNTETMLTQAYEPMSHPGIFAQQYPDLWNTPGGTSSAATSAQVIAAATSAAAAAAEAAATQVASTLPRAISQGISEQTAQQVQIQIAGNAAMTSEMRAIRRQLQKMNDMLPRAFRDTVAGI